jgi:uncharacterized protein (DUF2252 family)
MRVPAVWLHRPVSSVDDLVSDPEARRADIVARLVDHYRPLIEGDPQGFVHRFRKMAAGPFPFFRGSTPVFYADVAALEDRWLDDRTRRVWIHGDLHAENVGTYMDSEGILVLDVNDFDEAYVGPFTWDLRRMVASVALLGYDKALSDEAISDLVRAFARSYLDQVATFAREPSHEGFRVTLEDATGALADLLTQARSATRFGLLEGMTRVVDGDRRFKDAAGVRVLDDDERARVLAAYESYRSTIPEDKRQRRSIGYAVKDVVGFSGFGIGSGGFAAYNLLVEGQSQALENDVLLSMKTANVPAPSAVVDDGRIAGYFEHQGHRTAVSQRALQARSDPWLGWCEIDGTGFVVQELSPYEIDLEWSGIDEPADMHEVLVQIGRATAKVHCMTDQDSEQDLVEFQVEEAIATVVGDDRDGFVEDLTAFALEYGELVRDDHRRFVDAFRAGEIPGLDAD